MAEMNTSSWKEFRLDELFDNPIRGTRLVKEQRIAGDIPLITAGFTNQGVAGFISNEEQKTFNGGLTIDMFGNCFFRDYVFKADDNILVFDSEDISKEAKLFIMTSINKATNGLYSYSNQYRMKAFDNTIIKLPVTSSGEIDWQYMQERIAELEQERIAELEQERIAELEHYLVASGLNDYELTEDDKSILATELFNSDDATELPSENGCRKEARKFRVGDLFEKVNPRFYGKPNTYIGRKSCTTTEPDATHTIPLTCAKHDNNGVMYYGNSNLFESVANCLVMIRDGAVSTGLVFAHEDPVGVLSHSYLMKCKDDVSFRSLLYVSSVMTKTLYPRYNRSDPSYWDGKVENDRILLPVTYDGLPDWSFMEKYIRAVEKVVIKDVVDWKDEEIKKTKEIVS